MYRLISNNFALKQPEKAMPLSGCDLPGFDLSGYERPGHGLASETKLTSRHIAIPQIFPTTGFLPANVLVRVACTTVLLLMLLGTTVFAGSAYADGAQRSRAEAVEIARQRSGDGRVLSVKKTVNQNGVSIYAVKIISNGRVKVYRVREFKN